MRPSHDRISIAGVNPFAPSFDTVGVLACSIEVLAKAASVLLSSDIPSGFDLGVVHLLEEAFAICDAEVKDALAKPVDLIKTIFSGKVEKTFLKDIGKQASESGLKDWCNTYYHVQWAEIWSCLGTWVEEARPEFGPTTEMNFEFVKNMDRGAIAEAVRQREIYFSHLERVSRPQ